MNFSIEESLDYAFRNDAPSEIVRAFVQHREHRDVRNPTPFVKVLLNFLEEDFARKEFEQVFRARLSLIPDESVPPEKLGFHLSLDSRFLSERVDGRVASEMHFFGADCVKFGKTARICRTSCLPCPSEIVMKQKVEVRDNVEMDEVFSFVVGKKDYDGCLSAGSWNYRVLDIRDGRFYLMAFTEYTRKDGEELRQIELRYEGGIPGFRQFRDGDELQLVRGLEDLAKAAACEEWGYRAELTLSAESDFVRLPSVATQHP